jgi:hypothetical protein
MLNLFSDQSRLGKFFIRYSWIFLRNSLLVFFTLIVLMVHLLITERKFLFGLVKFFLRICIAVNVFLWKFSSKVIQDLKCLSVALVWNSSLTAVKCFRDEGL